MPPLVTRAGLARKLGVSRPAITQAIGDGRIHPNEDGLFDLPDAIARWELTRGGTGAENGRKNTGKKQVKTNGTNGADYYTSRASRENYQALLAKLDYEQRSGQLVKAEEVRARAFTAGRRLRDRLQSMADRIATLVAGTSDRSRCHQIVAEEVNRALDEMAREEESN